MKKILLLTMWLTVAINMMAQNSEQVMKADLMQMLANFSTYLKNDFQDCAAPNSLNEACGCFKGENTMGNDERGVRPNADLSMICAFLVKYGKDQVTLPANVTWDDLEAMAKKSLVFAYSTHKANKLKVCAGNKYWGSTSTSDAVWESSLWAMSVAYSAFFQWDKLTDNQKGYIYNLLKAECNYELGRSIPIGFNGDTKAEENGWEADVLAATLGLFPNDELAPRWFQRLREFAINSYSQKDDATDETVIDPDYDQKRVKDLYKGQNLYDDFTLQNHNYFHTSYQNVVIQELGEAALALKLFQQGLYGEEKWKTNALMHNNDKVMSEVLYWLALSDGELAMPNGNDWSLFLYDQITSYSTNACFLRDPHALMLEGRAYQMIKSRQQTTTDGQWLLRPDVGARRMGVEAHRVMMTWLMHELLSTADLTPTSWEDFNRQYAEAKVFATQNIVRASTQQRFTTFSWSSGLQSYTGYIAPHVTTLEQSNLIVPYRANNTGNFIGWYDVSGKKANATPVVSGIYDLRGNSYVMNGELNTNDASLNNRFAIYSTPGNAVIYIDYVRANAPVTITAEKGGLMAISMDEFTKTQRTFYTAEGEQLLDGITLKKLTTPWVNIDNQLGIVTNKNQMGFGERSNNNSVMTSKLYTCYDNTSRSVKAGQTVDRRAVVYYSNTDAQTTAQLSAALRAIEVPEGWQAVFALDPDNTGYFIVANFASDQQLRLPLVKTTMGYPVLSVPSVDYRFALEENHSHADIVKFYYDQPELLTVQEKDHPDVAYFMNLTKSNDEFTIRAVTTDGVKEKTIKFSGTIKASIVGGDLLIEEGATFPVSDENEDLTQGYEDITEIALENANFENDETYGKADGSVTLNGVTYNPCYTNTVAATNTKWANILPVKGWKAGNTLSGGSNFCRMYSMPYSTTQFCASPSSVGNYTARCSRPMADTTCGDRVLTVLNSWDAGTNAITQSVTLPKGKFRLLMDARYECPNQTSNNGTVVTTSGNNTCTSMTGIKIGSKSDYRYPSVNASWQLLCFDFELTSPQDVTISMGYKSSASAGAANNTLLYLDNVRLLQDSNTIDAIREHQASTPDGMFYDLMGRRVAVPAKGLYIYHGKKIVR